MRHGEGSNDGIKCVAFDIEIDLVFKEESWMLKFQSALLRIAGNATSNKKPRIARESDGDDEEEEGDDEEEYNNEDQKRENKEEVEVRDQRLSVVPFDNAVKIKRVFFYDYLHVSDCDGVPNSPPCDTFSDAGSMSIFEPETVTLSIEKVGQMIENPNHSFFIGKNPEVAHIKDKALSKPAEAKDENNHLYLSRYLHEGFDGINTQPSKFPWFIIHYVSHEENSIDHGALQQLFGAELAVHDRTKRYHPTVVHIEFFDLTQAKIYSPYLRNGCARVNQNDPLKIQMNLFFSDPNKAKKYLNWKEKRTRKQWDGK